MESTKITLKIFEIQRTMFNNTCDAMTILQENSENMMNVYLRQCPWTDKSRKPLNGSMAIFKESTKTYQEFVDDCFQQFENAMDDK